MPLIFHATSRTSWSAAQQVGLYAADTLAGEGFIHCSKPDQILDVADRVFAGRPGLVLLVIDPARLTSEVRWEPGTEDAAELYPHVYGPLNLESVVEVFPFEPGADGRFSWPLGLPLDPPDR